MTNDLFQIGFRTAVHLHVMSLGRGDEAGQGRSSPARATWNPFPGRTLRDLLLPRTRLGHSVPTLVSTWGTQRPTAAETVPEDPIPKILQARASKRHEIQRTPQEPP